MVHNYLRRPVPLSGTFLPLAASWLLDIMHTSLKSPVPDSLVVLTFDDAVSNHSTFVAPLLKRYGFGGTFFICEFPPDFETNKTQYMTWGQIKGLQEDGFDVGNHTGHHRAFRGLSKDVMIDEIAYIERRFRENGIPSPVSFCYPENAVDPAAFPILIQRDYCFARCGGERTYCPTIDHPLQIPSFGVHGTDPQVFYRAVEQARDGQITVLMFHGVPEHTHPWVSTPPELFEQYMRYLNENGYSVIAMRELHAYASKGPERKEQLPR